MDPQGTEDYSLRNGGNCGSNGAQKRADRTKVFMLFPLLYFFQWKNEYWLEVSYFGTVTIIQTEG
jgi:hypothetical protein